jgi:hypothetical protein
MATRSNAWHGNAPAYTQKDIRPLSKLLQIEIMNSANQVKAQSKAPPAVSILATDDLKAFDPTDHMLIEHTLAG